ncbi:MAG: GGDEF domain-containing protein [Arcobacter sp.]|nr:GGDEF domain-containing protein [Arcobacter sp.]
MNIKRHKTLIGQLDNLVDAKHLNEVKKVIEYLTKINTVKIELLRTVEMEKVYEQITTVLSSEFKISHFMIANIINGVNTIKWQKGDNIDNPYVFTHTVSELGIIEISLNTIELDSFEKIYLDSFLDEIANVLYIKYVLKELHSSVFIDHLTQLKNRQSFDEDMKEFIPLALREKMNLAALIVNIDRFRAVNDEHGRTFGDKFLKLYADVIKKHIRNSDIAVRFGGGEFLILLINVVNEEKVLELASKLKDELNKAYLISPYDDEFKKTVCIGISMFPKDSSDINEVIRKAEIALGEAQFKGRDQIARFEEPDGGIDFF